MEKPDPTRIEIADRRQLIADECLKTCQSISSNFVELEQLLVTIEDFIEKKAHVAAEQPDWKRPAISNRRCGEDLNRNFPLLKAIEELIEREKDTAVYPLDEPASESVAVAASGTHEHISPYWWVQTILQIRSAFVVALMSAVRFHLIAVAQNVRLITQSPIGVDDLSGSTFKRSRRYLEAFTSFRKPSKKLWERISDLYVLRNILAHRNGMIDGSGKERKIKAFVNREAGISIKDDQLQLDRLFCESSLKSCREFLTALGQELTRMCKQQQADT